MKKIFLLLILCAFFLETGCNRPFFNTYTPSFEYTKANYSANPMEYLGKWEGDPMINVFELDGLPHDYLWQKKIGLYDSSEYFIMSKNVQEPIFRYEVYKVEIIRDKINFDGSISNIEGSLVIEDNQVIADMLSLRASGYGKDWEEFKIDPNTYYYNTVSFYFDLPCELSWESSIFFYEDENKSQKFYWRCYDVMNDRDVCYDITDVFTSLLKL